MPSRGRGSGGRGRSSGRPVGPDNPGTSAPQTGGEFIGSQPSGRPIRAGSHRVVTGGHINTTGHATTNIDGSNHIYVGIEEIFHNQDAFNVGQNGDNPEQVVDTPVPVVGTSPAGGSSGSNLNDVGGARAGHSGASCATAQDRDRRLLVFLDAGNLEPTHSVRSINKKIFKTTDLSIGDFKWKFVAETKYNFYWGEFQKKVRWEPNTDAHGLNIRAAWSSQAGDAYKRYIHSLKAIYKKAQEDGVPAVKPRAIKAVIWNSLLAYWGEKTTIDESSRNTANRNKGAQVTYGGGCRSARHTYAKMVKNNERGGPWRVFKRTHFIEGVPINQNTRELEEAFDKRAAEASQPLEGSTEPRPFDEDEVFGQAINDINQNKRKRFTGLGSCTEYYFPNNSCSTSSAHSDYVPPAVQRRMDLQETTIRRQEEEIRLQQEEIRQTKESTKILQTEVLQMKDILAQFMQQNRHPPQSSSYDP